MNILYFFTLGFLFLVTTPVYAATTPDLGAAAAFGILSSTYTNTVGGTTINGDLGYTTGPATAPSVNGTTHAADGTYNTAGTDQGSALTALASQSCTHTFPAGAVDLATDTSHGTIGVYAPGVYCTTSSGAASIGTGGITLSGSGTYIFRINDTLTTAANSVVTLSGASACDVFWTPTAATTLGANSTFAGTDIDNSGITIGSTVTWTGRALAFGGTVSTTTDTITVPTCTAPTSTPTPTSTTSSTTSSGGGGDGLSDGLSDGKSDGKSDGLSIGGGATPGTTALGIRYSGNPLIPGFPNTGIGPDTKNVTWRLYVGILLSIIIFYLGWSESKFFPIVLLALIFGTLTKSVMAQASPSVLYVPLIGLTSVPKPLALPKGAGNVTYNYAVKNFLPEVPLAHIQVTDDTCSPVTFISGDDNGDSMLDFSETWRYTCTTRLSATTKSTATATGTAHNITATHKAYATVVVGSNNPAPLVSIVNITKVAYPLSLPEQGGKITFTYKVNNPGVVPLADVTVTDDKCRAMSGKLGDTNGNNLLDIHEVWIYTCTTGLRETTTNTANVTAFANGLKAVDEASITVKVAQASPAFKITVWKILSGILGALIIVFVLTGKRKSRKTRGKKQ